MSGWKRVAGLIFLGMLILFLDFFAKGYVYHVLSYGLPFNRGHLLPWPIFSNFLGINLSIDLALNKGMAWGMMAHFHPYLFIVRVAIIAALFVYLFFFNKDRAAQIPLVFIAAGALGNIVDFILYGFVIDFLHFNFWGYDFPIFNFSDSFITLGVIWLLALSLFRKRKKELAAT